MSRDHNCHIQQFLSSRHFLHLEIPGRYYLLPELNWKKTLAVFRLEYENFRFNSMDLYLVDLELDRHFH